MSCFTNRTVHSYASEDSARGHRCVSPTARWASVDAFFCIPDEASQNRLELYGSLGSILAQGTIGQGDAGRDDRASSRRRRPATTPSRRGPRRRRCPINPPPVNTYRAEIEEFSQAILESARAVEPAPPSACKASAVLAACYESARTGKADPIEPWPLPATGRSREHVRHCP